MQKPAFHETLDQIIAKDARYQRESYNFLRETLEFTQKRRRKSRAAQTAHVSAKELLIGFRDFTLEQFGPMSLTVLNYWGIHSTSDIGQMVFNLINSGAFGRAEEDKIEDFDNVFSFGEVFVEPFRPITQPKALTAPRTKRKSAPKIK